jgi:DNA-binding transcriptional MerR regulator
MQKLNINITSKLSGVAPATIRAWEKRYNVLQPERTPQGHRLYSEEDIKKLSLLLKLTLEGHHIGRIAGLKIEELEEMTLKNSLHSQRYHYVAPPKKSSSELNREQLLQNLLLGLRAYHLGVISRELEKAKTQLSPVDFVLSVISPLFSEIGKKVAAGEFSIVQEHTLSAIVKFHMGQMIAMHLTEQNQETPPYILVTPPGEYHEFGLMCASLLLSHYNKNLLFLGPNISEQSLQEVLRHMPQSHVIVAVAEGHESYAQVDLKKYICNILPHLASTSELIVGGVIRHTLEQELTRLGVRCISRLDKLNDHLYEKSFKSI